MRLSRLSPPARHPFPRRTALALSLALTLTLAGSFLSFLRISPDWQIGAQGAILVIVLALRLFLNKLERQERAG